MSIKRTYAQIDRGTLGTALWEARRRARLTQAEVAQRCFRSRPFISNLETGALKHVNLDALSSLSAVLNIDLETLTHLQRVAESVRKVSEVDSGEPLLDEIRKLRLAIEQLIKLMG